MGTSCLKKYRAIYWLFLAPKTSIEKLEDFTKKIFAIESDRCVEYWNSRVLVFGFMKSLQRNRDSEGSFLQGTIHLPAHSDVLAFVVLSASLWMVLYFFKNFIFTVRYFS